MTPTGGERRGGLLLGVGGGLAERVSIVIPCRNAERWLGAALDSALAQTWPSLEVIVVDDGSSDGSAALARSYGERVRVLTGPCQGPGTARNVGLAAASGRWIQFLDADDLLLPKKVEVCLAAVEDPARDIVFAPSLTFGGPPPGPRWPSALREPPPPWPDDDPLRGVLVSEVLVNGPVYPADRLRAVGGFRDGMRWLEDIDLNLRLVLAGARLRRVDTPSALIRDHRDPGRQRLAPGAARGRIEGERQMLAAVDAAGRLDEGLRSVFADRLAYAARQAWLAGELDAGREAFALAMTLSPRPRATRSPPYDFVANWVGPERLARWTARR